jgi:hypothetical protein
MPPVLERLYGHLDLNGHQLLRQRFEVVEVLPAEGLEGQPVVLAATNQTYLWSNAQWRRAAMITERNATHLDFKLETGAVVTLMLGGDPALVTRQLSAGAIGLGIGRVPDVAFDVLGIDMRMVSIPQEGTPSKLHTWTMGGGKTVAAGDPFLRLMPIASPLFGVALLKITERDSIDPTIFRWVVATVVITESGAGIVESQSSTGRRISMNGNSCYWENTSGSVPTPATLSAESIILVDVYSIHDGVAVEFL